MTYNDMNNKTIQALKKLSELAPERHKKFNEFIKAVDEEGALDLKTKELIAVALALKAQCSYCIGLHVKKALGAGATKDELVSASMMTVFMGGGPSLMYVQEVLDAIEEFS